MNQNETASSTSPASATTDATKRTFETLLTTLVDVGSMWAVHGLKIGKMALATSAETLGKTAAALDTIATELEKKHATAAPAAEEPPTTPAS